MADISKFKLTNGTVVTLKDAQGRANLTTLLGSHALEALGAAAWKALAASIAEDDQGLATAAQVKNYVDSAIETIPTFDVVIVPTGEDLPAASADTFHKIYLKAASAPATPNLYVEYITIRSGILGAYTYSWEKIGDTEMDLSGYVQKTTTIAGIDLQDNITVAELQEALELGALAYKDDASGTTTLNTIDTITMDEVTVAGDATVTTTATSAVLTKGNFTPSGSVSIAADAAGTQISGTVSKPGIDVDDSTTDTFIKSLKAGTEDAATFTEGTFTANVPTALDLDKFNGGTAASWTGASHTAASLGNPTKSAFATEGIVASIDETDNEMLVFAAASTSQAVIEQGTFTADVVDFGTFDGGTAASLATGFYTPGTAAQKAADSFNAKKLPVADGTGSAVTAVTAELHEAPVFTGDKFKATFAGSEAENVLVTGVTYDKADSTAAFSETVTPTVASYSRTPKNISITVE